MTEIVGTIGQPAGGLEADVRKVAMLAGAVAGLLARQGATDSAVEPASDPRG